MKKKLITLFSFIVVSAVWQMVALYCNQPELIPPLPRIIEAIGELGMTSAFYHSLLTTIGRGLTGMMLSLAAAFVTARLFIRFELLYKLLQPLLVAIRSVPVISFILLALIFLPTESIPLMIAFITMYPLLTENLTKGLQHLHQGFASLSQLFHIGRYNRLTQIIYPQLKPYLFSGLASASGFGWRAIIMGEVLSQCNWGIGSEMKKAQNFIAVPELIAWTLVAILISYFFDRTINALSHLQWRIDYTFHPHPYPAIFNPHNKSIKATQIGYVYGVKDFTYHFKPDTIYGISAPSGSGKTTLLKLISGTLPLQQGKLETDLTNGIAFVFQEPELLPHLSAIDNIKLPLARLVSKQEATSIASLLLCEIEMEKYAHRYPHQLSYGQQQRIALARALAYPSPFLLMDEPFKGLDTILTEKIIKCIRARQQEKKQTIIFTSHNQKELALLADITITKEDFPSWK